MPSYKTKVSHIFQEFKTQTPILLGTAKNGPMRRHVSEAKRIMSLYNHLFPVPRASRIEEYFRNVSFVLEFHFLAKLILWQVSWGQTLITHTA